MASMDRLAPVSAGVLPSTNPAAPSPPPLVLPDAMTTNAVNRGLSDLHAPTWLALLTVNISARTLAFHPMQLAIARKRVTRAERPPTVGALVRAAYEGGRQSFPNGKDGSRAVFDFGRGGVRGLYRGVGAALFSNLVGEISYLFTLEMLKERLEGGGGGGGDAFTAHSAPAAVGAMAGDLVALLLVTPTVVLCNRQLTAGYGMAESNTYRSAPATFREVWGAYQDPTTAAARSSAGWWSPHRALSRAWWQNGFRGIYQGTSAGILRIPSSGCWWALYTKSKEWIYRIAAPTLTRLEERHRRRLATGLTERELPVWKRNWLLSPTDNPLLNATAGILASVSTTTLFNPLAVIQTRQQSLPPSFWAQQGRGTGGAAAAAYATANTPSRVSALQRVRRALPFQKVYAVAVDLVRTEGPRAFFKGTSANVGVAVMDGVIFSLLFELSKLGSDTQLLEQGGIVTATDAS